MIAYPSTDTTDHNQPVYTVGEISQAVRHHIEGAFERVRVRGEITGVRRVSSGHLYFSLKDENALLKGVCWRAVAGRLAVLPEDGSEVIVSGRLTTYPGRSEYQIVAEAIELAGEGALLKLLEERRKRLAGEGLFAPERKKALPFLPECIGVVTSPTGAVLRDILHRLADRFPRHVLLWPVAVQGEAAAEQIAAAIRGFSSLSSAGPVRRPDLLIVARGGGSLEDLWAFNEEIVVRAAAESTIPLISAVGHETDTTLIDFAADRRAPTPTAAAEIAVPVRVEILSQVLATGQRLLDVISQRLRHHRVHLEGLARGIPRPWQLLGDSRQRLDDRWERLANGFAVGLDRRRTRLAHLAGGLASPQQRILLGRSRLQGEDRALTAGLDNALRERRNRLDRIGGLLDSFSYQRVLERGFVLVQDAAGSPVTTVAAVRPAARLSLRFHDGEAHVSVVGRQPMASQGRRRQPDDADQGRLL